MKEELQRTGGVSQETSRSIAIMRFVLPFAVMAVHVFTLRNFHVKGIEYDFSQYPVAQGLEYFVKTFISDFSVPCFFFISGFLFFSSGFSGYIYKRKLRSRFWSLLVPYLLWNLLMVGYQALHFTPLFTAIAPSLANGHFDMTPGVFFLRFVNPPHIPPLWFIRELMTMVLISPVIFWLVNRFSWKVIAVMWCVWAVCMMVFTFGYILTITQSLLFFSAGSTFAILRKDPVAEMRRHIRAACIIFGTLGLAGFVMCFTTGWQSAVALKPFSVPCALVIAFTGALIWGKSDLRQRLLGPHALSDRFPGLSFMIFASHWLIIYDMQFLVFAVVKPTSDIGVASCVILSYICLGASIMLCYRLLGRVWPAAQRLLTGRAGKKKKRAAATAAA